MPVIMTASPIKGVPGSVPGDTAPVGEAVATFLPSILNAEEVEFDIVFTYKEDEDDAPILEVKIDTAPAVEGLTFTVKGTDTVNVKGKPVNVFKDEVFRFLFADGTEKNLSPTNTEDWDTIVKWAKPSKNLETVTYSFTVKYDENPTAVVPIVGDTVKASIQQNIFWKYEPSLAYFNDLLKKGKY